jgi:hypothetical protein
MGAGLKYIDIGGGLGVDYDGSRTNYASSMNYSLAEYASDVVYRIANVCNARGIEHPVIVSESGRAITAHHSVLVFNTLGGSRLDKFRVTDDIEQACRTGERLPPPVRDIFDAYKSISERRLVECFHDALQAREQALQMFNLGYLGLESRSIVERLYWATCTRIRDLARKLPEMPEELGDSSESSATSISATSRYSSRCRTAGRSTSCSRSCRSIGSTSAAPHGVLADITCDSDGKIDHFVSLRDDQAHARAARAARRRDVLPRRVPRRRVPGNARRPAQPVRRHARRAHQAARRRRLVDRGDGQGRYRRRGARVHAVRRRRLYPAARARLRARDARGRMSLAESQTLKRFYERS